MSKPSARMLAWTAQAHHLSPERHPHLIRYIACRGKWPTHTTRWGNARALEAGGWAARLWESGPLKTVTIVLPRRLTDNLEHVPARRIVPVLHNIVGMGPYRPEHAALRIEWALKAGWHFEGVVSERDAARLEGLPGDLRGATVNIRDLPDLTMYAAELRYMSKGARRRTGKGEKAAHAEKLQAMKDALGMDRLPGMVLHFGAADLACQDTSDESRLPHAVSDGISSVAGSVLLQVG